MRNKDSGVEYPEKNTVLIDSEMFHLQIELIIKESIKYGLLTIRRIYGVGQILCCLHGNQFYRFLQYNLYNN